MGLPSPKSKKIKFTFFVTDLFHQNFRVLRGDDLDDIFRRLPLDGDVLAVPFTVDAFVHSAVCVLLSSIRTLVFSFLRSGLTLMGLFSSFLPVF